MFKELRVLVERFFEPCLDPEPVRRRPADGNLAASGPCTEFAILSDCCRLPRFLSPELAFGFGGPFMI